MIKDETVEALAKQWDGLTRCEKDAVITEAEVMRKHVRAEMESRFEPVGIEGSLHWSFINSSYEIAKGIAEGFGSDPDFVYAVELATLKAALSPKMLAWEHARQYLFKALNDPYVMDNPATAELFLHAYSEVLDASPFTQKDDLFWRMKYFAAKEKISDRASSAAKSKNAVAREFVVTAYNNRTDKGQSKASFSTQYAGLVKSKFQIIIGADTIARDWLPKSGKGALGVS